MKIAICSVILTVLLILVKFGTAWLLADIINSVGLICGIIGVILLFQYGFPSKIKIPLIKPGSDEDVLRQNKKLARYKKIAYLGLGLLILGTVLQLLSNHLC